MNEAVAYLALANKTKIDFKSKRKLSLKILLEIVYPSIKTFVKFFLF